MKKVLIGLGILAAIIAILGVVAPSEMHIERDIVINQPEDVVFAQLKSLRNQEKWNPWLKKDPNVQHGYEGDDGTVGFKHSWKGNSEVGIGEQELTKVVEGERIESVLRFKEPMEDTANAFLATEPVGDGQTKVTWGFDGHNPFPMNIICMIMDVKGMITKDFDDGLKNLKGTLEGSQS